jgi:hypothetical protein
MTAKLIILAFLIAVALFNGGGARAERVGEAAHQSNGRVTRIELGSKQGGYREDDLEVSQTNEFAPETPRIICRWQAEGIKAATVARGVWIAEDTNGAMEKETILSESKMNVPVISNLTGIFILRARAPWAVGKYRLDLYLGDVLSKSIAFVIKEN